jgi:hypothetical protein
MATVKPGFVRDAAAEAAVIARGKVTKEQIEARGGLNAAGYYGDSWDPDTSLTDAEYKAITDTGVTGDALGAAINSALAKKTGNLVTATDGTGATGATGATGTISKERQSAYDVLFQEFNKYGLGSLVASVKDIITNAAVDPAQMALALQNTKEYQERFSANKERIKLGLRALSPAEYTFKEDAYQEIMRQYGLPASYYAKDATGKQAGFDQLLANNISDTELEDRIMTAQQRVINANPEVLASLRAFYPGISNGDILAYTLDPKNAITEINRKVTAAEIGGAAMQAGLTTDAARAQELQAAGIDKGTAQTGFQDVAEYSQRGGQLAAMYGESPYTQQTAEQEVFNLGGSVDATKQRKKLVNLERAEFSGQAGIAQGALGRERAGNF